VKALALSKDKAREPAKNPDLDTGIYGRYPKFQAPNKIRLEYLNKGQFEKPVAADGGKCMPRLLLKYDTKVQQGVQQPMANTTYGILSCAFDAERITAYGEANAKFKTDMLLPGSISLPKLQNLVLMDLAYLRARHLKWEDKMRCHLGSATARSSDDDAPAPASSPASAPAASAVEFNFMKWDLTNINSVPWDQLSLTGSKTMKYADIPQYLFPFFCLASEMIMLQAKEPKAMIDFSGECKTQIESAFGESTDGFLSIACAEPPVEWRRQLRNEDYTAEETKYIKSIWEMAAKTYQSIEDTAGPTTVEGGSQEISTVEGGPQEISTVSRDLRSKDIPKPAKDPGGAQPSPGRPGREKQKASVRMLPVVDRGEQRSVSSDRGGRKRGRIGLIESSARLEVPLSPATGRMLLGQVSLNFRYLSEIMRFKLHFA
jgi:hypothetical protein